MREKEFVDQCQHVRLSVYESNIDIDTTIDICAIYLKAHIKIGEALLFSIFISIYILSCWIWVPYFTHGPKPWH